MFTYGEKEWQGFSEKILAKRKPSEREQQILDKHLYQFTRHSNTEKSIINDCVSFILGNKNYFKLPLHQQYFAAQKDIKQGRDLPLEVLEGIRSTYRKHLNSDTMVVKAKDKLTKGQKLKLQKKADQLDISIQVDFSKYDLTRLYIYCFARGLRDEVEKSIEKKVLQAVHKTPFQYRKIGLLVDDSDSMRGHQTQALKPLAISLALRDILCLLAPQVELRYTSGRADTGQKLLRPLGNSNLARPLLELMKNKPDVIFILSDGYENAPKGRVDDLARAFKRGGHSTLICQISPVMAAEDSGLRRLSKYIPAFAVSQAEFLPTGLLATFFVNDVHLALNILWSLTSKQRKAINLHQDLNEFA